MYRTESKKKCIFHASWTRTSKEIISQKYEIRLHHIIVMSVKLWSHNQTKIILIKKQETINLSTWIFSINKSPSRIGLKKKVKWKSRPFVTYFTKLLKIFRFSFLAIVQSIFPIIFLKIRLRKFGLPNDHLSYSINIKYWHTTIKIMLRSFFEFGSYSTANKKTLLVTDKSAKENETLFYVFRQTHVQF